LPDEFGSAAAASSKQASKQQARAQEEGGAATLVDETSSGGIFITMASLSSYAAKSSTKRSKKKQQGGGGGGGDASYQNLLEKIRLGQTNSDIKALSDMSREEKREYADRLRAAQSGPKIAQQKIKHLDVVVAHLKQQRADCQRNMDESEAEIRWIESEERRINKVFKPLQERKAARLAKHTQLADVVKSSHDAMAEALAVAKLSIKKSKKQLSRFQSAHASQVLQQTRGYKTTR
jgi:hypothetical protein